MALKLTILSLLALCVLHSHSFTAPSTHSKRTTTTAFIPKTTSTSLNLNIPRINLPEAVGDALESIDLQNPNELSTEDYNAYSGAAILGTLAFFLLPGAVVAGVPDVIGQFFGAAVKDFAFSAIIGGGIAIYLSLRRDEVGSTVRGFGTTLLEKVDGVLGNPQIEGVDEEEEYEEEEE